MRGPPIPYSRFDRGLPPERWRLKPGRELRRSQPERPTAAHRFLLRLWCVAIFSHDQKAYSFRGPWRIVLISVVSRRALCSRLPGKSGTAASNLMQRLCVLERTPTYDAADVPITTSFGKQSLEEFRVYTEEIDLAPISEALISEAA